MTTFDRHIALRLVKGFAFFIGALILFFIVLHYVEYSDDFVDRGATLRQVFLVYYPNYVPEIVRLISPLALFLSSVYITGTMAQNLELVALQTSGVSLYRLMVPYLVVGVAVTGFMFWFNGWIVPTTQEVILRMDQEYIRDAARQIETSDIHRQNRPGHILSVGYYDRDDSTAHRVSLQRFAGGNRLVARTDASRMEWIDSLGVWRLTDATERIFDGSARLRLTRSNATIDTTLLVYPRDLARTGRDAEAMTIPAAAEYVSALRRSGAGSLGRPLVAYYTKFSYPLANLLLILISVPLAAVRRRGGQAVRIGLGLAVAFVYLALQKLTEPFGYSGDLSPLFAAWFPHAVFAAVALVMLWRVRK